MTYSTPLKSKLSLGIDDIKEEGKLVRLMADLEARILTPVPGEIGWSYCEAELTDAEAMAADTAAWAPFTQRTVWSKAKGHTWFAAKVTVPEEARGRTFLLRFSSQWQERPGSTDPQCLAHVDGRIVQAIDGNHTELVLMRDAVPGTVFDLRVNAFTWFDRPLAGFGVEYMVRHEGIEALYHDIMTPFEAAQRLHQTDPRRHAVFHLVNDALRALDRRGKGLTPGLLESLPAAQAIADRIYDIVDTDVQPQITAFGHTHLDVAWLWRVLHVRQKTGRSFATILKLIEEFPDFIVMYNQAVLFDFLKSDYPDLWEGVKAAVKTGQWDIDGAMWVEPDANIVSGESMVRQILWGRRFHMTEFGVTPRCVWLPDTFGYSANMPQIIQKSGLNYFLTSKLSWNDTDRHPYDTFWWKGIDGTETKAHLITAQKFDSEEIFTTYNSDLSVSEVMGSWKRYEPKAVHSELALCYGYGDGGGGPTRAMIQRGQRLAKGVPGAPRVKLEGLGAFLDRLGPAMEEKGDRFPRWNGELYLQYHRGTLTNVAKNKKNNRDAERALREVEALSAMALALKGHPWPEAELDRMWRILLINQFHDILPGTSIPEVYEDSDAEYAELFATAYGGNGLLPAALSSMGNEGRVVNLTGRKRDGLVAHAQGQEMHRADGSSARMALARNVPALGWSGAALVTEGAGLSVSDRHLENDLIRVTFGDSGEITSVFDKHYRREVLRKTANRLVAYEDKSMNWDAWDIDWYFEEQYWALDQATITVVETGPLRAALRIERPYRASRVVQIVSLEAGAPQIEFDTFIDWHERHHVLKAEFALELNVSELRSEIQFGHVTRPTHRNTTWDRARFEASMHRWVDMSEPDFGVALINDSKYACSAKEQTIGLTLVRGATHPHPLADEGEHRLRYAMRIHAGTSDLETVHHAAEAFNNPLLVHGDMSRPGGAFSFAASTAGNVALETLKRAEDGKGLILRAFEHANRRAETRITFGLPVKSVRLVNLMEEEPQAPLTLSDNGVTLALKPFEIATLWIEV